MADNKSWPSWKRTFEKALTTIHMIIDSAFKIFEAYDPDLVLSAHSGGGSFIFGYIDGITELPLKLQRIVFLDANYGYIDSLHRSKLSGWLKQDKRNNLVILAYNDSVVIYNGKPLVSPTGGAWYRTKMMQRDLADQFSFKTTIDSSFINHKSEDGRIRIHLKKNPRGIIYHTVQVEKNGFIYGILSNTKFDKKKYFTYFGSRAYEDLIKD